MKTVNKYSNTFVDVLVAKASATPKRPVYHMLSDDGAESGMLTFGELDRRARALGQYLQGLNAQGERALLVYPAGLDYIAAFFGCLYGGAIAVPAYPPRMNRNLARLESIVEDSAPKFILTDSSLLPGVRAGLANHPAVESIRWIATDLFDFSGSDRWTRPPIDGDDLAFLQYTSGSTAAPKGVMVSHDNLLHNEALIQKAFGLSRETIVVSWLPIYHDMGLIGNILACAYNSATCHLMSPAAFLRRPATWLEAISRLGATASGGPNFAYDLCVQKVQPEQCAGLDLSEWRIAYNGAEPVRAATLERFAEKFSPYGFRKEAFFPCYGLAESTVFVTGGRLPEAVSGEKHVSSGGSHAERVVMVDPKTGDECSDGQVGEIWISDPSVARGYWNKPDLSGATFAAHLATSGEGPFLRTGDLGVMRDGELFVMGRMKDLIIIRGRNHYPQDIEISAESSHGALRPGCTVAFGVEAEGEERLIIVAEAARDRRLNLPVDEIGEAVHRAVANEHGVAVHELVLIQPASSFKTSSGKLQRSATRDAYLAGRLEVLKAWRNWIHDETLIETAFLDTSVLDRRQIEAWLEGEVCVKLKIPAARFDRHRPIAEYGLDSLAGVELAAAIEEKLGIPLPFEMLFVGEPNLSRLSGLIRDELARHAAPRDTGAPNAIRIAESLVLAQGVN